MFVPSSKDDPRPVFDARVAIHAGLTTIMAWLAIRLAMPDDTFATTPSFAIMARLATENVWAMWFWFVASVGLVGLTTRHASVRLISIGIVSTAHGLFAGCLLMAGPNTGAGTYAIIACMGYYLLFRRVYAGL